MSDARNELRESARGRWDAIRNARTSLPSRDTLPEVLIEAFHAGDFGDPEGTDPDDLDRSALAVAVHDAWTYPEFPALRLRHTVWEDLFFALAFLEDDTWGAERPASVPALYRSAVVDGDSGLILGGFAWADSMEKALWFHRRNALMGLEPVVLQLKDQRPGVLLARFHGERSPDQDTWIFSPRLIEPGTVSRVAPTTGDELERLGHDAFAIHG